MRFSDGGIDVIGPTLRSSPLYAAGIDRGDRIVEIDGKKLKIGASWTIWPLRTSLGTAAG